MRDNDCPTFINHVCKHYADLIRGLATNNLHDLDVFAQWSVSHPLKQSLLAQSRLPVWWHEALFQEFKESYPATTDEALAFLRLLSEHKRLGMLSDILACVQQQQSEALEVYWQTAQWLTPQELSEFQNILTQRFQRPVRLHQSLRPDLILGGILLWEDRMLDLSLFPVFSSLYHEAIHAITTS